MRHDRAFRLLADYSVGRLRGRKKRALERHIIQCPLCARELGALYRTQQLLNSAGMIHPTSPQRLWQGIQLTANQPSNKSVAGIRKQKHFLRRIVIATALGLFLLSGIIIWRMRTSAMTQHLTMTYTQYHHFISWANPLTDRISTGAMLGVSSQHQ